MPDAVDITVIGFALILTVVMFYYGFINRSLGRGRLQAAFFIGLAMLGVLIFQHWRAARAPGDLARLITPYPNVTGWQYIARFPNQRGRSWLFAAADPPRAIHAFYRDERNRPGWELTKASPVTLRRTRLKMTIVAISDGRGGSRLFYHVSEFDE